MSGKCFGALGLAYIKAEEEGRLAKGVPRDDSHGWACGVYQAKCAKALFASAMRCVFSRTVIAAPSRW